VSGHIYFIATHDLSAVKVGFTDDVVARRTLLQIGNAQRLHIIYAVRGTMADEVEFHRRLAAHRIRGEWFLYDPVHDFIDDIEIAQVDIGGANADQISAGQCLAHIDAGRLSR
jgi:hypothetical protein